MRLFGLRGGVHPEAFKQHTETHYIRVMPIPRHLYIPLQQHIGAPAKPEAQVGDYVAKGQLLARSQGLISAAVHAPSSGVITEIGEFCAPHPSGLPVLTITLETDGEDRWIENDSPLSDPFHLPPREIGERVGRAGVVGMGGATFPSAVKLMPDKSTPIDTVIINGSECEPYLTCDDRLMQERAPDVIDGIRLIIHAVQAQQAYVAIEDNKPRAFEAMHQAAEAFKEVNVVKVPSRYPMGWEKQLIKILVGQELPFGQRASSIGVCVHNVGTAYAVHQTLRYGRPLVSRIVTVAGGAVCEPQNLEVPVGALVSDVLDFCGGLTKYPARLIMGGPMMGQMIPHTRIPVVKGSSGILALTEKEVDDGPERPCIHCGRCVEACPVGLMPVEMVARIRNNDLSGAQSMYVEDCISCGCCSYVCPSKIPLVQSFNYAKGELQSIRQAEVKADRTKTLAASRMQRLEKEAEEKAALKARKAAAKKKADSQETAEVSTSRSSTDDC